MASSQFARYVEFRPAWKSFGVYFLGAAIFFLGPLVNPQAPLSPAVSDLIGTCFLVFIAFQRFTKIYRLGAEQLTREISFPKARTDSVKVADIRRVDLRRGLTQRMLGVAHVHVYVEGREDPVLKLFGVPEPEVFRRCLVELGASDARVTGAWRR